MGSGSSKQTDSGNHAAQMAVFKDWWFKNKDSVVSSAVAKTGVSADAVRDIVELALPVLLTSGKAAARDFLNAKLGPNNVAAGVLDAVADQLGTAAGTKTGSGEFYDNVSDHAYQDALDRVPKTGGCDCERFGSGDGENELDISTIRDYANSSNSKAKNQIIEDILSAGTRLGMKITGDTHEAKIKSMLELMPTGSKISASDDTHKKLCASIAIAINKAYGNDIIDAKLPADVICQQVAEIVSSLSAGMHTEFLAVYNDVRRVLKNLHVLKSALKDDHEAIKAKIMESEDKQLSDQVTSLNDLHEILLTEINRQIGMLQNLLNVTLFPADKSLSSIIKNKKDLHGYIEKIDVKLGSDKFGKVISDILKGLGMTANFAAVIEKALKTVGMTMQDYATGDSILQLREKITRGLMGKTFNDEQLHEYLEAAELLYRNFYRNQDIAEIKTGSSQDTMYGGEEKYQRSTLDKRIDDKKKLRTLIFNAFYRQINAYFDQLVSSLDSLTMKVGTEIPLSEQLNGFRQILQRVDESLIRNKNIYYALIGYYNDALSKSKKETLLADLRMVSSYIDTLLEMPVYSGSKQYFTGVQAQIKAITDLIDRYSDEIAAKFGRGEEADPQCMYMEKMERAEANGEITGSFEGSYELEAVFGGFNSPLDTMPEIKYKSTKTIHDAVRQFDYKVRVAQIRSNMSATGKELKHYSEKYEKLVANSIADILSDDKKIYDRLHKQLADDNLFGKPVDYVNANTKGFNTDKEVTAERQAALKVLESNWDVKKRFWATVEAVDTYMRVFTDALVNNPADIKEIKSMLDEVEVINDWYSEKTGNDIASVFDYFPSGMTSNNPNTEGITDADVTYPPAEYTNDSGSHYYQRIKDAHNALPGNPYLVTPPSKGEAARAQTKKALGGLAVLKNLLSVFIHVGSKFGGEELRKKVFMSPTQMYNNLVDYLQASAFTQGFAIGEFKDIPETDMPEGFYTSDSMAVEIDVKDGSFNPNSKSTSSGSFAWTGINGKLQLGVTNKAAVEIIDQQYPQSPIGRSLVDKINAATIGLVTANNPLPGLNSPINLQQWKNTSSNAQKVLLFKKRWGVWMRSILEGLKKQEGFSFVREDDYFVLILKSLAAKILTVTGMYDVLDRPMEYNGLSPIRMITGGDMETPKVDEGAVALYLRLPLLAQFYRTIFGFNIDEDPNNKFRDYDQWRAAPENRNLKISMVPDIDGVFAGLVRIIFRKNKNITGNNYSEDDIKELVREINLIYQRMSSKYPQNTVMETINEFVAEINRRYGVVSENERNKYEHELEPRYDYAEPNKRGVEDRYNEAPETNFAILPGEDDEEVVRPSAAQRLLGETFETSIEKKRMYTITSQHRDLIYRFRCAMDKYFENPDEEHTFNHAIKATQMKLKREQNDEARFKLVASLVRGIDVNSKIDGMKYVLFHETVVSGLNLLSAMHSQLARFKQRIQVIDLISIEEQIWKYLGDSTKNPKTMDGLVKHVADHLTDNLGLGDNGDIKLRNLVRKLFGFGEAQIYNGGHSNSADDYILKGGNGVIITADIPRIIALTVDAAGLLVNGQGLCAVLNNKNVNKLRDARKAPKETPQNKTDRQAADTFMRFIFGREYVMKELVESLFGFSQDFQGIVDVKLEDGKINLSYGGLKTMIEDMFQHITYFLDLLRPHVKADVIVKYTNKKNPGSYYWLQEQLMEKIINGRPQQITAYEGEPGPRPGYANIDELVRKLNFTYYHLTRSWNVDGAGLIALASTVRGKENDKNNFDKVFAEMAFYDSSKPSSGLIKTNEASETDQNNYRSINGVKVVDYLHDPYESLHLHGPQGTKTLDTRFASRFYQLYSWKNEFNFNRSALFSFNQLVAKFIQAFYDPVSGKIYNGVLNQFANGAFNRAVADPLFTYPDTVPLWFIKYAAAGKADIPNSIQLASGVPNAAIRNLIPSLQRLIKQYLDIGINFGDHNRPSARSGLLKITSLQTFGLVNNFPTLFVHLLAHAIGATIRDYFVLHSADPAVTVLPPNIDLVLGFDAAVATVGAARALYNPNNLDTTSTPTIENIMDRILGLPTRDADINTLIGGQPFNNIPQAGSPMAAIWGPPAPMAGIDSTIYRNVFNQILSRQYLGVGTVAGILPGASLLFPLIDDVSGRSEADIEYRAELFASILARLVSAAVPLDVTNIRDELTTAKSTYAVPSNTQPKFTAKQDDLYITNDKDIFATALHNPAGDVNYLVMARNSSVANAINSNNIKDLQLDGGKPHDPSSDTVQGLSNFGQRMDPDSEHILYSSLAQVIKNLLTSRNVNNQSLVYVQDNVADIALYMKEKMRANLPAFKNLFKELVTRCEFIKRFMNQSDLSLERKYQGVSNYAPTHNPWPYVLNPATTTSNDTKSRFTNILDGVIKGCNSLITSCDQLLKEIGDDPKYFELYQNSIKDYKTQYGVDPLMPLSSTLAVLKNVTSENELDFFPIHSLGEDQFKLMYGMRSLLGQPTAQPLPEHILGFSQIVDSFNLSIETKLQADKSRSDSFMKSFVKMLRYIFEAKHIKGILTPYILVDNDIDIHPNMNTIALNLRTLRVDGMFSREDLITDEPNINNKSDVSIRFINNNMEKTNAVYSICKTIADIVKLTESSFKDDKIKELVEHMCGHAMQANTLEIRNIIDLNIVPINVHALMREIPLVNLYNYAYTFDRLIIELYYGLKNENAMKLIRELCSDGDHKSALGKITSSKDMLVALLLNPYLDLFNGEAGSMNTQNGDLRHYDRFAKSMLSGAASNGELGRPKFLSDQIFNKAVFGELYPNYDEYNEMGPAASSALRNNINESEGIHAATQLCTEIITSLAGGLPGRILTNAQQVNLIRLKIVGFFHAILKHIASNSTINVDTLSQLIFDKFLNPTAGITEFKLLFALQNNVAFANVIATITANISKIVYNEVANVVNSTNSGMNVNIGSSVTNIKNLISAIPPLGGLVLVFPTDANISSKLVEIIRKLVGTDRSLSRDSSTNQSLNSLHYLDINVDKIDAEERDRLQPSPFGDNANVIDDGQIKSVDVTNIKNVLASIGRLRFDTVFIRNLIFIVNLYRSVRMKLQRDLVYSKDIIMRSTPITRVQLTEFYGNEVDQGQDHTGHPNRFNYIRPDNPMWKKYNY